MQHINHPTRVSKYQEYEHDLNISGIQYPVDIKDIGKSEHQNNISVNVSGYEDKKVFSLRITTVTVARHHVNLYYINDGEKSYYVLVNDLSRLVLRQNNNDNNKRHCCQFCLHGCTGKEVSKNHMEKCKLHGLRKIKFPEAGEKKRRDQVKFTKTEYQLSLPFVIYADFESVLCKQNSCETSSLKSFITNTNITYHPEIYVKCTDKQYFEPRQVNMEDDNAETFQDKVLATATICRQHQANEIPM